MGDSAEQAVSFRVIEEQPIASLVQKGLDKAVVRRYRIQAEPVAQKSLYRETGMLPVRNNEIRVAL